MIIAHHDTVIEADDHVIVFCVSKRLVPKVEKLFQVGSAFSDACDAPAVRSSTSSACC